MKFLAKRSQRIEGIAFRPMYETNDPAEIEKLKKSAWFNTRFWEIPDDIEDVSENNVKEVKKTDDVDLSQLDWIQLRKLAKEKGVQLKTTMKRNDIITAIKEIDNGNEI